MNLLYHVTYANANNFANNSFLLLLHPNKKLLLNFFLLLYNAISTYLPSIDLPPIPLFFAAILQQHARIKSLFFGVRFGSSFLNDIA